MYKDNIRGKTGFDTLDLDDREINLMKKFIRNESASGYTEETNFQEKQLIDNYKSLDSGRKIKLPVFNILRDGKKEETRMKVGSLAGETEVRTIGVYNARDGNEWEGFLILSKPQQKLLYEVIKNISHHTAPYKEMGARLREVRMESGYGKTLQNFATFLSDKDNKVARSSIRDFEFGARAIPERLLFIIKQKCEINREWLLHGRGQKKVVSGEFDRDLLENMNNRLLDLDRVVNTNAGFVDMQRDGKTDFNIPRGNNYLLRQDLNKVEEDLRDMRDGQRSIHTTLSLVTEQNQMLKGQLKDALAELTEARKVLQDFQATSEEKFYDELRASEAEDRMMGGYKEYSREQQENEKE